jgi:hypothetical protein
MPRDLAHPADLRTQAHGLALRATDTAWLVGAGASAESHVPTAGQLIDRLLLELYARENDLTVEQVIVSANWLQRVRAAYDGRGGLPPLDNVAMYGAIFDRVFPNRDARARFLTQLLDGRSPHFGHHVLAAMMCSGFAPLVVTTNFDHLVEDAAGAMRAHAGGARLTLLTPDDSSDRMRHVLATDPQPLLVKIHGDLGSVTLMNTSDEITEGDERLRAAVRSKLSRYGLIVVGYSGRDAAVMGMLSQVLDHDSPYPAGLTWVRRPEDELPDSVRELLQRAREAGVEPVQEFVAPHFGELMTHVRRAITFPQPAIAQLDTLRPVPVRGVAAMPTTPARSYPQVRLAAVEILDLPGQARVIDVPGKVPLADLRRALRETRARANVGVVDGQHVAFGRDSDLEAVLRPIGGRITSDTLMLDLDASTTAVGFVTETLTVACGRVPGLTAVLRANQRHQVRISDERPDRPGPSRASSAVSAAIGQPARGSIQAGDLHLPWAEAITVSLQLVLGRWHLLFAPDIWTRAMGETDLERAAARRVAAEFTRERLAPRYTRQTGAVLGAWLSLISGTALSAWDLGPDEGIAATFRLSSSPLTSRQADGALLVVNGGTR